MLRLLVRVMTVIVFGFRLGYVSMDVGKSLPAICCLFTQIHVDVHLDEFIKEGPDSEVGGEDVLYCSLELTVYLVHTHLTQFRSHILVHGALEEALESQEWGPMSIHRGMDPGFGSCFLESWMRLEGQTQPLQES